MSHRSRRFFKVLGSFLDSFRAGGGLQRWSLRRPVSLLLSSDTVNQACEKRKRIYLHFPLRHRACRSSAGLLKFARLSGKQTVVVTRTMCQVGGAVLASLYLRKNRRRSEDDDSHTLLLCRRTIALVQVTRWQSARVFCGNPCKFGHVGIQPCGEKCCNFSFSPQPLDAESGRKTELACRANTLRVRRVQTGGGQRGFSW